MLYLTCITALGHSTAVEKVFLCRSHTSEGVDRDEHRGSKQTESRPTNV